MKNCGNCGAIMNDADIICQNCGARSAAPQAPKAKKFAMPDLKKLPKKYINIGAIVAGALVLIIVLTAIFGASYKDAVKNYVAAEYNGKYNKIEKLAPKAFWEYVKEELDFEVDEMVDDLKDEEYLEEENEYLEDTYGENFKATIKIVDKIKLNEDDLDSIKDEFKKSYDISKKSVKKAYSVVYRITLKGSEEQRTRFATLTVVKIGNKWYPSLGAAGNFVEAYNNILAKEEVTDAFN